MSASSYQVVFTGTLRKGIGRRQGIRQLAQKFGLDFDQIKRLLVSSRPIVKQYTRQSEGERLMQAFWQAGWHTELMSDGNPLFDMDRYFSSSTAREIDDANTQTLFSESKCCSIEVPANWEALIDLNRSALIQSGNLQENQFLVVLSQKLSNLTMASSVGNYCGAQLRQCATKLRRSQILTPATPLAEGGFPGYFGEITAEIDAVPLKYLVVCLNCGEWIYTLFIWCEAQQYQWRKKVFERMVQSFSCTADAGL